MSQNITVPNEIIVGLIEGDRDCLRRVYECYQERIYLYVLRLTKSREIAEEVVQDVFIKVWTKRHKIDTQYCFSSFLFRVAHNHTINVLKRSSYEKIAKDKISKTSSFSVDDTEDNLIYKEYLNLLRKAIDQLPPRRKVIFNLSRQQGVSHDEIALEMGISKNTVKSQLVKATKYIKSYLLKYGEVAL
jgi:RNA polymerase sigma-70 factor (ECF subfamily)